MTTVEVHDGFTFLVRDHGSGHTMPIPMQLRADGQQIRKSLLRHVFGILLTVLSLMFTVGLVLAFLTMGWHFAAIMSGLIGLLSIAVGITYWLLGETK